MEKITSGEAGGLSYPLHLSGVVKSLLLWICGREFEEDSEYMD